MTLLVHPDPAPAPLAKALAAIDVPHVAVDDGPAAERVRPEGGFIGGIFGLEGDGKAALELARWLRENEGASAGILMLAPGDRLDDLAGYTELFDDFCLMPFHPAELEARIQHLVVRSGADTDTDLVSYGPLVLNVQTYQAVVDGRALDLTYMEYELLRYLASQPGKVFSREKLLSEVWGYDYYGGARTVDVHIRRLRAKLGEEHASLITTVRSVGYRFGAAYV